MWQEFVVLAGSIAITISLVPTILDEEARVPLSTSVPSVAVLLTQTWAFVSMGLTWTAAGTSIGLLFWTVIALLKGDTSPRSALEHRLRGPTERPAIDE